MSSLLSRLSSDSAETIESKAFVDNFKHTLSSFSREEQLDICKQIQPLCSTVTGHNVFGERTITARVQLSNLVDQFGSSKQFFERITNETFVIDFTMELMDLHVHTHVKINFGNLFYVSRSYDGDTEGGDFNDEEMLPFYTNMVTEEDSVFDKSVSYENFKRFVAELFLVDFDYMQEEDE